MCTITYDEEREVVDTNDRDIKTELIHHSIFITNEELSSICPRTAPDMYWLLPTSPDLFVFPDYFEPLYATRSRLRESEDSK